MTTSNPSRRPSRRRRYVHVQVSTRAEGAELVAGLALPDIRAFVRLVGALERVPTDPARTRVLQFVIEKLAEVDECRRAIDVEATRGV